MESVASFEQALICGSGAIAAISAQLAGGDCSQLLDRLMDERLKPSVVRRLRPALKCDFEDVDAGFGGEDRGRFANAAVAQRLRNGSSKPWQLDELPLLELWACDGHLLALDGERLPMLERLSDGVSRGDLDDLDGLSEAAAAADGVIDLAFKHEAMRSGDFPGARRR